MHKPIYAVPHEKVRTTVDLPVPTRDRIQAAVEHGAARSQNALIVQAIEQFLRAIERQWLDAQFAAMAEDDGYRILQLRIAEEFVPLDWEALRASHLLASEVTDATR